MAAIAVAVTSPLRADNPPAKPQAPGLGNPGKLTTIVVDSGRVKDGAFLLSGRDASQQLVVTGQYDSGQTRDLTGKVQYKAEPDGIVTVDATGYVAPVKEGTAKVRVLADATSPAAWMSP